VIPVGRAPIDVIFAGPYPPDAILAARAPHDTFSAGRAPHDAISAGPAPPDAVPAPRNAGSTMDGYQDYFTLGVAQGGSSSSGSATTGATTAADFGPFSQAPSLTTSYLQLSPNYTSPRCDMDNLDLNSQVDNFPFHGM
jgi:hypothetical protein